MAKKSTSMNTISVYMVTWNVQGKPPSEDINGLLGLDKLEVFLPDFYLIGLQEVSVSPGAMLMDALFEGPWNKTFRNVLSLMGYVKVRCTRLQGIMLMMFTKREHLPRIQNVQIAYTRTGLGGVWGNKGAVSIRMKAFGCPICIVNCHLAAHESEIKQRIDEYNVIIDTQSFKDVETETILCHDYIFWMGDLNFRIEDLTAKEIMTLIKKGDYDQLLLKDQLKLAMSRGDAFSEFTEPNINFAPTYKFEVGADNYDLTRKPSYTDRILFKVNRNVYEHVSLELVTNIYHRHAKYQQSDHKPVSALFVLKVFASLQQKSVTFQRINSWKGNEENTITYYLPTMEEPNMADWIGLYKADFSSLEDYIAYIWASGKGVPPSSDHHPLDSLPHSPDYELSLSQEPIEQSRVGDSDSDLLQNESVPAYISDLKITSELERPTSLALSVPSQGGSLKKEIQSTDQVQDIPSTSSSKQNQITNSSSPSVAVTSSPHSEPISRRISVALNTKRKLWLRAYNTSYTAMFPPLAVPRSGYYRLLYLSDGINNIHGMSDPFEVM